MYGNKYRFDKSNGKVAKNGQNALTKKSGKSCSIYNTNNGRLAAEKCSKTGYKGLCRIDPGRFILRSCSIPFLYSFFLF